MRRNNVIILLCLFFISLNLQAQEQNATIDFKDGSRMIGDLHKMDVDSIWINSSLHGLSAYHRNQIQALTFGKDGSYGKPEFHRQKYQIGLEAALMINRDHLSPSIQIIALKQFHKLVYAGIGTGINIFDFDREEISYPIFLSGKFYLRDRVLSPFIQLNAGYAFGQVNDDFGITNVEGGMLYNPRIGVEFGNKYLSANLFAGMKFQKLAYDFIVWNGEVRETKNHRRIEVGASFIF